MANWFVDSAATGADDGTSTTDAWITIERPLSGANLFTSGAMSGGPVTGAGDIVWIKDNHHETWDLSGASRIRYQGSSDPENPVIYRADLTGVHFSTSGGRPRVQMNNVGNAYFDEQSVRQHLRFEDIDFDYGSADGSTNTDFWRLNTGTVTFVRCNFGGSATQKFAGRFNATTGGVMRFIDCTWDGSDSDKTQGNLLYCTGGEYYLIRSTMEGYKWLTQGFTNQTTHVHFEDLTCDNRSASGGSVFGMNATSGRADVRGRGLNQGDFDLSQNMDEMFPGSTIEIQDLNDPRIYYKETPLGTIESTETSGDLRAGGSDHNFVMTPTADLIPEANSEQGLELGEWPMYAESGVSRTYTLYVKTSGWTSFPTAAELVFEVGYYDTASSYDRTWTASTDTVSSNGSWTALEVSGINPSEDGNVLFRVRLLTNDGGSGEDVIVDPRIEVA